MMLLFRFIAGRALVIAGALLLALHPQAKGAGILELLGDADVILLGEATAAPSPRAGAVALHVRGDAVLKGSVAVGSPQGHGMPCPLTRRCTKQSDNQRTERKII
jgi:hypothetical protein